LYFYSARSRSHDALLGPESLSVEAGEARRAYLGPGIFIVHIYVDGTRSWRDLDNRPLVTSRWNQRMHGISTRPQRLATARRVRRRRPLRYRAAARWSVWRLGAISA